MERGGHHSESTAVYILGMHEDKLCIIHLGADHSGVEKDLQGSIPDASDKCYGGAQSSGERYFWFAADQFPQVNFTLLFWNATGLWGAPGSRAEEIPTRWRSLTAEKMLPLRIDWPCVSSPPLLLYFSYGWKSGFLSGHFAV